LPDGWDDGLPEFTPKDAQATRAASGKIMNALAAKLPELVGGSADLAASTNVVIKNGGDVAAGSSGARNVHFGIREHAMGAILNGLALHRGVRPVGSTFLIFSDYMRPPIRLAAQCRLPVIYLFSHDSIGLGEDGPTHQPIEHLAMLRSIPNLTVIRPADAAETAQAWRAALARTEGPTALILPRQMLPVLDRTHFAPADGLLRGGYVLYEPAGTLPPQAILIATGSEVQLALGAAQRLEGEGIRTRVVSLPSWELFRRQPAE